MKNKVSRHIFIFIIYILLVIFGISKAMIARIGYSGIDLMVHAKHGEFTETNVKTFIREVDTSTSGNLRYHDQLIDLNSAKDRALNTRIVKKDSTTIIKTDTDYLVYPTGKVKQEDLDELAARVDALRQISEKNGAGFLYIAAPRKEYYSKAPGYINNASVVNFNGFIQSLEDMNVPTLDLSKMIEQRFSNGEDAYFATDHHWTPYTGFQANQAICEELHELYNMPIDESKLDYAQYNTHVYQDWFLGSQGKKVGTYFTSRGADDFELITPKFETQLSEEQPFKNEFREGSFEETVLYLDNMEKDYYHKNSYATYSGGDFRLQIIKNKLNTEGKKILIVRDSYACAVVPFLSLQASEIHVVDIRPGDQYVGDRLSVYQYIEEIKPDYVLVLYCGISNIANEKRWFNFE